jgi:hypothetical protein
MPVMPVMPIMPIMPIMPVMPVMPVGPAVSAITKELVIGQSRVKLNQSNLNVYQRVENFDQLCFILI